MLLPLQPAVNSPARAGVSLVDMQKPAPVPYPALAHKGKKEQVALMFDNISARYDLLNRLLSFRIDVLWRKAAIRILRKAKPERVLDVATGTGDFAIAALQAGPRQVVGVDISEGMLAVGREKLQRLKLEDRVTLSWGDSEALAFADNSFDAATVAFGVRNFENLQLGLEEILRVTRPGSPTIILEFSAVKQFPMKQFYGIYSRYIMPTVGKWVSKDASAYTYLPESIKVFPERENFLKVMRAAGYSNTYFKEQTFGICCIYVGYKP